MKAKRLYRMLKYEVEKYPPDDMIRITDEFIYRVATSDAKNNLPADPPNLCGYYHDEYMRVYQHERLCIEEGLPF